MMERRRALILPFTGDKHSLMDNPLIIPTTCFSSECVKLETQVSWTAIAGCKLKQNDTQQKNGSLLLGQNRATMVTLEMSRRKPCLILTDVLKTEQGKTYLKRIKHSYASANGEKVTSAQRESGLPKNEPLVCREKRSNKGEPIIGTNKSFTPKPHNRTTQSPSPRQKLRRTVQTFDDNGNKQENKDIKEMTVDKEKEADYRITEVVDCGLSVSWEPAEDERGCHELSLVSIKDSCTDSEKGVQPNLKRKRKDSEVKCNGTLSPKRHRESVLRLTGEDRKDTGSTSAGFCLEDSGEDRCLENMDRSIVQFTVGGDDRTEVLVPIISSALEAGDDISSPRRSLSLGQKTTTKSNPPEPIVLSSEDEESGDISRFCSPEVQTLVTVEDTVIQGQASHETVAEQQEASNIQDMQVLRIVVPDLPNSVTVSPTLSTEYSIGIAFSTLYCGSYQGKAKGNIMIADQNIIIPLKDISERVAVTLTLERKELRRYSVWEQEEIEAQQLFFKGDEDASPPSVLLLCVSQTAAAALQRDLRKLCVKQDGTTNTGKASPFILMTLRNPLEGMEGALFRSLLDIDCLNSLSNEQSIVDHNLHTNSIWECINNPVLSLDESIDLIRKNGLDSDLMSLLGLEMTDSGHSDKEDDPHPSRETNTIAHIRVEVEPHKDTLLEVETASEQDTRTNNGKVEDQKEQELEHPSEKEKEEPTNLYTLCHQRTKESYSVSLCKPSYHWTKFKHQGLTRRLIQFPPPPLKGGITVTMEDLQCLDSGQFLNDVIIDFYLKYLIQNASAAVAERCHIFSSFFYKQLTRRDNASEGITSDSCQRQRRHQRVRTWTRHVDLFEKDFLFVPVNQEAHWYLVLICFPGLEEPKVEALTCPVLQATECSSGAGELQDHAEAQGCKSPNGNIEKRLSIKHNDSVDKQPENSPEESIKGSSPGPVNCTEQTCQKKSICKRPCILIMDSLKLSLHERVFKLLREYLQSEWEARRGSVRDFGPDQMKSSHCLVPLQDNSSDCGLYLLQYVESFLKDPVVHFDLPLHLERWFPRQKVRRKRDEIRDLVLNLYRHQTLEENR